MRQFKSDRQAFWYGVRDGFLLIAGSAIAGTLLAVLIIRVTS